VVIKNRTIPKLGEALAIENTTTLTDAQIKNAGIETGKIIKNRFHH
jgi:hypothetical protein